MKPYELPLSRARALYRIPGAPPRNRVLELCCARTPLLLDAPWDGESRTICDLGPAPATPGIRAADFRAPLPFEAGSFDLIVLHKTLDDLKRTARDLREQFDVPRFLAGLHALLAPGGLVAGCVGNAATPKRWWRRLRGVRASNDQFAFLSAHRCRTLLHSAGFTDTRVLCVLPDWQAPQHLIDTEPTVAKFAFRHLLEVIRPYLSAPRYAPRRVAVELGVYPHLEESLLFWGYKPC